MKKPKIKYVDGYVMVVPKKNLKAYKAMATLGSKVWRKYGALDYKECVAEDMKIKGVLQFPTLLKLKPGEVAIFSYVGFASRAQRDRINAQVMKDSMLDEKKYKDKPMPFDMKRMAYGGFEVMVDGQ